MAKLRYHHVGIPTEKPLPKEDYNPEYKMTASGYYQSKYGIEWMNFDGDCPLPELVKTVPHVAFVVDDLKDTKAVTVAFIVENGAPIEFLQFDGPEFETWPHESKFRIE